jgi:hypothetical protein
MKATCFPLWLLAVALTAGCGESGKKTPIVSVNKSNLACKVKGSSETTAATACAAAILTGNVLYVDAAKKCEGNTPCYEHPQDAVNAADPGDTIRVYPGTYGSRVATCTAAKCDCANTNAPALIVYKDNLTIESVGSAAETIIESTHQCWSTPEPVSQSTRGAVASIAAPNGVSVLGKHVVLSGFTLRSDYQGAPAIVTGNDWPNTAGVMIGGLFAGQTTNLGATDTTVEYSIIIGHSGVYNWRASGTVLDSNAVRILGKPELAGIRHNGNGIVVSDGYFNGSFPPTSTGVRILNNDIDTTNADPANGGEGYAITFGGTESSGAGADQSGLFIDGNTIRTAADGVKFWHSIGAKKIITCNNKITIGAGHHRVVDLGLYDSVPTGLTETPPASTWTDEGPSCKPPRP